MLIKHRKADPALTANHLDPILTPIRHKVPATHARGTRNKAPTGGNGIFSRIQPGLPRSKTGDFIDIAEQVLKQVETMAGQVGKITTTGNHRISAPVIRATQIRR